MSWDIENLKKKAEKSLLASFHKTGGRWIAPSWPHYKDTALWDACFNAIVCHELGLKKMAENELSAFFAHQREDGFIPHSIFLGKKPLFFSERDYYLEPDKASDYPQPPVFAQVLQWLNDPKLTRIYLEKVIKFHRYLLTKQDPDGDDLISVCHPHETGRDSDPIFDSLMDIRCSPGSSRIKTLLNGRKRWQKILELDKRYREVDWDIEKIWKLDLFNVEDVMFNSIWVQGMRALARLLKNEQARDKLFLLNFDPDLLNLIADRVEKAIYEKMWDEEDEFFYALNSENRELKCMSSAGLFPLILEKIPENMVEALVRHLREEFAAPYPIPTVPTSSPFFDPGVNITSCCWRGPVWINMNWFIIQGLVLQAKRFARPEYFELAREIAGKTIEMVDREGFWEFYNPFSGQGLRIPHFDWSTLVITLPKLFR